MYEISTRAAIIEALSCIQDRIDDLKADYQKYLYVSNDAPAIKEEIEYLTACAEEIYSFLYGIS